MARDDGTTTSPLCPRDLDRPKHWSLSPSPGCPATPADVNLHVPLHRPGYLTHAWLISVLATFVHGVPVRYPGTSPLNGGLVRRGFTPRRDLAYGALVKLCGGG